MAQELANQRQEAEKQRQEADEARLKLREEKEDAERLEIGNLDRDARAFCVFCPQSNQPNRMKANKFRTHMRANTEKGNCYKRTTMTRSHSMSWRL